MMVFLAEFFNQSIWQQIVATVIGAILGIPIALWLNRRIASSTDKQRERQLRAALKRSLEHNRDTLKTIAAIWADNRVPSSGLDLTLLEATAHLKYELLNDLDLCAGLDHLHFELSHLQRYL